MGLYFDISSITPTTGGGGANLTTLDVTPSVNAQSILPNTGYNGFSLVNVSAVNASIDANITASNIKQGVDILGVTGTMAPSGAHSASINYSVVNGVATAFNGDLTGAFDGITEIAVNGMSRVYSSASAINSPIIFPDLTTINDIGMNGCFSYCTDIPSVDFPNLTNIGNSAMNKAFANCTNLISANFNSLTEINGTYALSGCFLNCINMTSVNMPNLETVGYGGISTAFAVTKISELNFPRLANVGQYGLAGSAREMKYLTMVNFSNVVSVNQYSFSAFAANNQNFTADVDFSSLPSVSSNYCFNGAFYNSKVNSVNFANLKTISGQNSFYNAFTYCHNLTSFNFDSLETIDFSGGSGEFYQTFMGCNALTTISFPNLVNVSSMKYCFVGCSNVTNVYMPNLYKIGSNGFNRAFSGCVNITNIAFNSLYNIYYDGLHSTFNGCSNLTELRFPALSQAWDNSFDSMLAGCTGVTVHFPAAMQSTMSGWGSVTGGFGGTNTTVLFDLNSGGSPAPGR